MNFPTDEHLIRLLSSKPERAIELIFKQYYTYLCGRIVRIVHQPSLAEDIAQEVFLELWKKRESLVIKSTLKAYLGRAGVNRALNYLRDSKPDLFKEEPVEQAGTISSAFHQLEVQDLESLIDQAIQGLPERCRLVFSLSRFEDLTNKEVALQLGISEKTVENQMTKALRILRGVLEEYRR